MPILFNSVLEQIGIEPKDVLLLRHQDKRSAPGRAPYDLWHHNRPEFERYQSTQEIKNRDIFSRVPFWASFVGTPDRATMFVGLYTAAYAGLLAKDSKPPHRDGLDLAGSLDVYNVQHDIRLADLEGGLFIEWGKGRNWKQYAGHQNKPIIPPSTNSAPEKQSLDEFNHQFEQEIAEKRGEDKNARRKRLKKAQKKPTTLKIIATVFWRNSDVVAEVLDRAEGICEKCKKPAPFCRASDGTPYLEIHHVTTLADGGDDTVENAKALCPNCHREAHFGE